MCMYEWYKAGSFLSFVDTESLCQHFSSLKLIPIAFAVYLTYLNVLR